MLVRGYKRYALSGPGSWVLPGALCMMLVVAGCSRRLLSTVFDVPQDEKTTEQRVSPPPSDAAPRNLPPPPIERVLDADSVRVLLPKDAAGNIDWMEALRSGVIRPRSSLPGEPAPVESDFGFDFYFPGQTAIFDSYFPHSSHTQWLACQQCHPRIFRQRGTKIGMNELFQGKYCGECHGKVSFPVATCERCHTAFPQPPNRLQPELIGNIKMRRVETTQADSAGEDGQAAAARGNRTQLTGVFPEATFPHWVHRIRYRCKVCHMKLFEPVAGANEITMDDIETGKACGSCHNGRAAFDAGFGECERCHLQPQPQADGGS